MRDTDKFRSDLEKTLGRAKGLSGAQQVEALGRLFDQSFGGLPKELRDGVFASLAERLERDTEAALGWMGALASVFLCDYDGTPLSQADWRELGELLSLSSGELDLEILEYGMALVVERGAL